MELRIKRGITRVILFIALFSLNRAFAGENEMLLPAIFDDHMVMQRDIALPVWGWDAPGGHVEVRLGGNSARTVVSKSGYWQVRLPAMDAGGPSTMTIAGTKTIELTDILIGDVWVCSGQSNMEFELSRSETGSKDIPQANFPKIRLFQVHRDSSGQPAPDFNSFYTWAPCAPDTAHSFSAVGYYFGRKIHQEVGVPIGLIASSWGGTRIEPWTPPEGFSLVPSLSDIVRQIDAANAEFNEACKDAVGGIEAWLADAKATLGQDQPVPPMPALPRHALSVRNGYSVADRPTSIYNAMIYPMIPYAIRGVIWYQGEQNVGEDMLYFEKMKALVGGWRKVWDQGDFPFYFAQLAPFRFNSAYVDYVLEPDAYDLPEIWEAQTASLAIPNTGMAITMDVGDPRDIHPRHKQEVGERLALWALAKTYGRDGIVYCGPLYKSMEAEGNAIRIYFDHAGAGLKSSDDEPLDWFEVAGADMKFVDAKAKVDGKTVVVQSDEVAKPVAVRFSWKHDAQPNLINSAGLPASAFRTYRDATAAK